MPSLGLTLGLALGLGLLLCGSARADVGGVVFVDGNGNGARDTGEAAWPGVVVTNGVDVTRSQVDGRYTLPERDGFVYLTRPDGFRCEEWYRRGGGDFALTPREQPASFFFVQISDAHVFDRKADFNEYSSLETPWFIPQWLVDWLTAGVLEDIYGEEGIDGLRASLAPELDASDWSGFSAYRAYREEFARDGSDLGDVVGATRAAFAEVGALKPDFVLSTGDLVLESNRGNPEAIERWFAFYRDVGAALGVETYNTIGNNEIAGSENDTFPPDDPRYGKHFFEKLYGPSWYSFDVGPYHFVALDTHRFAPTADEPEWWTWGRMPDDTRAWLEADLAAHPDRVLVVLNHEPFHFDDAWPFEPDPAQTADDEGLFGRYGVDYVLTGHVHFNSFQKQGSVTHITTGALSGFRWVLPAGVHERGYRLFLARERQLYSAWKPTGQPVLGWSEGGSERLAVAADRDGPFAAVTVERDGAEVPVERLGRYFVRVPDDVAGSGPLRIVGTRASGEEISADLPR